MLFLELGSIRKPPDRVADGANRKLNQDLPVLSAVVMAQNAFVLLPHLQSETDKIPFAAVDVPLSKFGLKQNVASFNIAQLHPPRTRACRQEQAAAAVEIKSQACWPLLGRKFGRRWIGRFRLGCRWRWFRTFCALFKRAISLALLISDRLRKRPIGRKLRLRLCWFGCGSSD